MTDSWLTFGPRLFFFGSVVQWSSRNCVEMLTAMEGFVQKRLPSPYKRLVLDRLLTAVLNYTDLVTDILVMLQYGCFLQHVLNTNCTTNAASSWIPTCEPHWWWFGLSLSILVLSTVAQAFVYTIRPDQHRGFRCLCCLGIFQLTYLRDLFLAVCSPSKARAEEEKQSSISRDFTLKIMESTPQLYLQSYVLFAIQAHGDPLKLISTIVSAASLALGLVRFMVHTKVLPDILSTFTGKFLVGLFLTTDQLLRASAYALMISESTRPIGIPLIVLFPVLSWIMCYKAFGRSGFGGLCLAFSAGLWAGHILPVMSFSATFKPESSDLRGSERWKQVYIYLALPLRYLEMICCGILGLTVTKTSCGKTPVLEMIIFFSLMFGNLFFCIAMISSWIKEPQVAPDMPEAKAIDSPPVTVGANNMPQGNEWCQNG